MKLLSNNKIDNHKIELLNAIKSAEEIVICTAFLKQSGLNFLIKELNNKNTKTTFYVGTNFYQTEPSALKQLFNERHPIFLNNDRTPTFHPKIFYFKTQNKIKLFVGSANLTSGGLETNIEISIECETLIESELHNDIIEQFTYFKNSSKKIETLETILDYEKRYEIYKLKHQKADLEFNKEEEKLIEEERKREEERLRKLEEDKLKLEDSKNTINKDRNRFAITEEYKESWKLYFEEFKNFKIENNGNTIIPKNHKLYRWYKRQREFYGHIDENGNRSILFEHLDLLNKENFFWGNPNEIQWMIKWENNLKLAIEYSKLKRQSYTWVHKESATANFKYKRQSQWCWYQRMRLNGDLKLRKITEYEIKRLSEVNFLTETIEDGKTINEDNILEKLILIENLKKERLLQNNYKWLPSQTDPKIEIANLGGWLNDKLEWLKKKRNSNDAREIVKDIVEQLESLGIDTEYGIIGTYFNDFSKKYIEMRSKYPIENPRGEERKPYEQVIQWEIRNRSGYNKFPEWRQKRLDKLGIKKQSPNS